MPSTSAMTIPPVSPYGTFTGSLFLYARNLAAFESQPANLFAKNNENDNNSNNDIQCKKKCILIGGLSDGLVPTPYTQKLEKACHDIGWSLVQPVLSSSYLGFGNGDLDRDTNEISSLMWYLSCHRSAEVFALVGHSTGCQNSIHFLKHGQKEMIAKTKLVVLQAPVSDREGPMAEDPIAYQENIKLAQELLANGKGDEMMPRHVFWAPITSSRFLDLHDKLGRDDFFSSDFTNQERIDRLGHVGKISTLHRVVVAYSGADEYVPSHVDKMKLTTQMTSAMNHYDVINNDDNDKRQPIAEELYLSTGNHNLSEGPHDADIFVNRVKELLEEC